MNLLPRRNLWVIKGVQAVRMISTTGPKWSSGSDGSFMSSGRPPVDIGKKPVDSKENVIETMAFVAPHGGGQSRKGGDVFKSIGTAKEAQFFNKKEKELLRNLKDEMKEQISFHEEQIAIHQAVIKKLKQKQQHYPE